MEVAANNGRAKSCGVCGDVAKSFHFGGLSCDSCKAFFRRSVQKDNYQKFACSHKVPCIVTMATRKNCQYCRMQRCFAIGMEKSWVMTDMERMALMKSRNEKRNEKQSPVFTTTTSSSVASNSSATHEDDQSFEPDIEQMINYMSMEEIKEIEEIVTKYLYAYKKVPYRNELKYYNDDRPGVQVLNSHLLLVSLFNRYCRHGQ